MRLQLSIQRHSLPPVQIIFTTGTGPASHTTSRRTATVADLLHDVNDLVPLESDDGEWGLEDYVVEVAATADQETLYECLHFQSVNSVLREDDEVVIRALREEERRARRLGGRVQISGDGRHLVDGVGFGKRWLRLGGRPGVNIPARKRRKLVGYEDDGEVEGLSSIGGADVTNTDQAVVVWADDEEDEEDDEDFVEEVEAESGSEEDDVDSGDEEVVAEGRTVAVTEEFDDADAEDEMDTEIDDEELAAAITNGVLPPAPTEVVEILAEHASAWPVRKRKRALEDEGGESEKENNFSGFSTPAKGSAKRKTATYTDAPSDSDSDTTSDSDADSLLEVITKKREAKKGMYVLPEDEQDDSSESYDDSSASESASSSENSEESSSDSENDPSQSTSSSGSSSESASTSESESSSSLSEDELQPPVKAGRKKVKQGLEAVDDSAHPSAATKASTSAKPQQSAPGQGTNRTKSNNTRAKMRKRLAFLKNEGVLPLTASFDDMRKYDERQSALDTAGSQVETQEDLEAARQELISRFQISAETGNQNTTTVLEENTVRGVQSPSLPQTDQTSIDQSAAQLETNLNSYVDEVTTDKNVVESQSNTQTTVEPELETTPRRAKLDLQSTRRMLFSSLGLRAPKTKAEEQKLRDKLAKSVREPPKSHPNMEATSHEAESNIEDIAWKEKLIVSAVECEQAGLTLPPPPFPFEQNWTKVRRRPVDSDVQLNYDEPESLPEEITQISSTHQQLPAEAQENIQTILTEQSESRTVSFGNSDLEIMPIPDDYAALPSLQVADLVVGSVIAYKELHVSAMTNFQPEISPYRLARIQTVDESGSVEVLLAMKDRRLPAEHDPETGERTYSKFELHENEVDDEADDGVREIEFPSLIEPKLVNKPVGPVAEVVQTSEVNVFRIEDEMVEEESAVVLETAPAENVQDTVMSLDINEEVYYGGPQGQTTPLRDEPCLDLVRDSQYPTIDTLQNGDRLPPSSQPEAPEESSEPNQDITTNHGFLDQNSGLQPPASYQPVNNLDHSTKSSSHQDAQRVSPAPQAHLELTISEAQEEIDPVDEYEPAIVFEDEVIESVHPRLPHSDEHEWRSTESEREILVNEEVGQGSDSFLGERGYDGAGSSYPRLDNEAALGSDSESVDSLPSVSFFTSSQGRRRSSPADVRMKLAPSEVRRDPVSEGMQAGVSTPPTSDPELAIDKPAPTPQSIKISASQYQDNAPSMSQIPASSMIIDLTQTSDLVSPSGSDKEYKANPRKARKRKQGNKANTTVRAKKSAAPMGIRSTEPNLGTKRFLTARKDQV